jgi:hypothetical protein
MKPRWIVAFLATSVAVGCSARGTSGTYDSLSPGD